MSDLTNSQADVQLGVDGRADRRAFLLAGLMATAGIATGSKNLMAADEHEHHGDHAEHMGGHDHSAPAAHQALIDAALKCVNKGEVCTNHCITMLGNGDTSLKDCIRTVAAMMPMCEALAKLAALESSHLKDLAKVCSDVCEDCQKECKKHAEHHAACKACAESCQECIDACKKVT
ncbi:MAG: four-helix bundle copper-binding protein [Hyphomicrobium sp.]